MRRPRMQMPSVKGYAAVVTTTETATSTNWHSTARLSSRFFPSPRVHSREATPREHDPSLTGPLPGLPVHCQLYRCGYSSEKTGML